MGTADRGQALVEFALVTPVLMFILLGFTEVGFLLGFQHVTQRSADAVADGLANGADPVAIIAAERARTGCDADPLVAFPDGTDPGDRVLVRLTCHYSPRVARLFDGIPVTVEAVAVIAAPAPTVAP